MLICLLLAVCRKVPPSWLRIFLHACELCWQVVRPEIPYERTATIAWNYIFLLLEAWLPSLGCTVSPFFCTPGWGECSYIRRLIMSRVVLAVWMVFQFPLVSWHQCHILGCMVFHGLMIGVCIFTPIVLPTALLATFLLPHLIVSLVALREPCWLLLLGHSSMDVRQSW